MTTNVVKMGKVPRARRQQWAKSRARSIYMLAGFRTSRELGITKPDPLTRAIDRVVLACRAVMRSA